MNDERDAGEEERFVHTTAEPDGKDLRGSFLIDTVSVRLSRHPPMRAVAREAERSAVPSVQPAP